MTLVAIAMTTVASGQTIELNKTSDKPFYYSVAVPDGNYTVTVTIPANTTIMVKQNGVAISPDAGTDNEFTVPYGTELTVEYVAVYVCAEVTGASVSVVP